MRIVQKEIFGPVQIITPFSVARRRALRSYRR